MQERSGPGDPAHHARRPMNAFLIFCKRHRVVVRKRHPNLENRSVTKILGEWWTYVDDDDKFPYRHLARTHKADFFSWHPSFKWYKLPAPPLRSLAARSRAATLKPVHFPQQHDIDEKTNNNTTKIDLNNKPNNEVIEETKSISMFTPGKLADEAQMGDLCSLLNIKTEPRTPNPYYSPPSYKYNAISTVTDDLSHNLNGSQDETIRKLQNTLSETSKVFTEEFDDGDWIYADMPEVQRRTPDNQLTDQQIVDKRYSHDNCQINCSNDGKHARSGRSCKGKKYQEFMSHGRLIGNKRQKRDYDKSPDDGSSANYGRERGTSRNEAFDFTMTDETKPSIGSFETTDNDIKMEPAYDLEKYTYRCCQPADFDLEAKIKALPELSYDKYQQMKRDSKRKKKIGCLKPKATKTEKIINSVPQPLYDERREMAENCRDNVTGSQKRKPRKVSITRLEINSMVSSRVEDHKIHPEMKLATEAPCTSSLNIQANIGACQRSPATSDLMALATLAEVASNTSKLDSNLQAKASEQNASQV